MRDNRLLRRILGGILVSGLVVGPLGGARADDGAEVSGEATADPAPRRHYDYSRFSDGPRSVPTPRGASLARARALGLGSRRSATRLLSGSPPDAWVRAARGEVGERLTWPVEGGRYGRGFGFTRRVRRDLRHDGIDVVAPEGSVVRAVADGIVAYSDNGIRGFGNCVLIVHPNGWVSLYAHQQRTTVQPGWRVHAGERIGFVGSTGISRGPHLHFELRSHGRPFDPARLFARGAEDAEAADGGSVADHVRPRAPSARVDVALARSAMAGDVGAELRERAGRRFSNLLWPVKGGALARGFTSGGHRGLDIEAPKGTAVRAAADGVVVYVGEGLHGLGESIVMVHENGWVTVYGSNQNVAVDAGATVRRGEWIAEIGDTGASEGAHLHFELHDEGALRDPEPLLVQVPGS